MFRFGTHHSTWSNKRKNSGNQTKYNNLDAIISVGYRVNSSQATAFRIWATERLKEYMNERENQSALDEAWIDQFNLLEKN